MDELFARFKTAAKNGQPILALESLVPVLEDILDRLENNPILAVHHGLVRGVGELQAEPGSPPPEVPKAEQVEAPKAKLAHSRKVEKAPVEDGTDESN